MSRKTIQYKHYRRDPYSMDAASLFPELFYLPAHRRIYDAIAFLHAGGHPIDLFSVIESARSQGTLDLIGGGSFIDGLVAPAPPAAHFEYHADRLSHFAKIRGYAIALMRSHSLVLSHATDSPEAFQEVAARIQEDLANVPGHAGIKPGPALEAAAWLENELPEPEQVLCGAFDLNTKTCITAPSKARKSFFALQAAVSISAGMPSFLDWQIDRSRTVLLANLEIPEAHFQRRLRNMVKALSVTPEEIKGRLHILNARGTKPHAALARVEAEARRIKAEVLMLDPIYKLIPGDESKQENIKELLSAMDRICDTTGAALVYVHHGTKGEAGDRLTIDRAAGSGVLARDVDCMISLVHHVEEGLLVAEQVARSYAPKDSFTIRWDSDGGCFRLEDGIAPVVRKSTNRKRTDNGKAITDADAVRLVESKPLVRAAFDEALKALGMPRETARNAIARLVEDGAIQTYRAKTYPTRTYYGTKEGIEKIKYEYENPQLRQ